MMPHATVGGAVSVRTQAFDLGARAIGVCTASANSGCDSCSCMPAARQTVSNHSFRCGLPLLQRRTNVAVEVF